jgi:hypothetical protein
VIELEAVRPGESVTCDEERQWSVFRGECDESKLGP